MAAVQNGHIDIVKALLEWGADTELKDSSGCTVDEINIAFNSNSLTKKIEIDRVIGEHRKSKGLEQFKQEPLNMYYVDGELY